MNRVLLLAVLTLSACAVVKLPVKAVGVAASTVGNGIDVVTRDAPPNDRLPEHWRRSGIGQTQNK